MSEQYPNPYPTAPPERIEQAARPVKLGGMAVAALVLGIIGICGSIIPILNFFTGVGALVGLVLGLIAAVKGSRKVMAWFGAVLSLLALVVGFAVTGALVASVDDAVGGNVNNGQVGNASQAPTAAAGETPAAIPTWGQRFTWPNGLAIEVAAPESCTPSTFAAGSDTKRALRFKVTIVNDTKESINTVLITAGTDAQFDSAPAARVYDYDEGGCKNDGMASATVLPGQTFSFTTAYAVGEQPGQMQLAFHEASWGSDKAVFVGQG